MVVSAGCGEPVRRLLHDAEEFLSEAWKELDKGLAEGKAILVRDAAEKAWNATVQALNAILLHNFGKIPLSHYERRKMLKDLEAKSPEASRMGFYDRYMARFRGLHREVFYEGTMDEELIRLELGKTARLIQDVEGTMPPTR